MKFIAIKGPANDGFYIQLKEDLGIETPSSIVAVCKIIGQTSAAETEMPFTLDNLLEMIGTAGVTFIAFPSIPDDDYYKVSLDVRLTAGDDPFLDEENDGFGMINTLQEEFMAIINSLNPLEIHHDHPKLVMTELSIKGLEFLGFDSSAIGRSTFVNNLPFVQKAVNDDNRI